MCVCPLSCATTSRSRSLIFQRPNFFACHLRSISFVCLFAPSLPLFALFFQSPFLFFSSPSSLSLSLSSYPQHFSFIPIFPRVSTGQPLLPLSLCHPFPESPIPLLILLSWPAGKVLWLIVHRPVEHARTHD